MAYIEPNSTIKLLKGVPLDRSYCNTIYWEGTKADQTAYFNTFVKTGCVFSNQYYQRYNKGSFRIQIPIATIIDCNYLMFQNTAYDNKWFYAFITDVEYVNDNVTEVMYEIDVLTTWFFDYTMQDCFVEREHIEEAQDRVDGWLQPESLETGDYIIRDMHDIFSDTMSQTCFMLIATESITGQHFPGMLNGIYNGLTFYTYVSQSSATAAELLTQAVEAYNNAGKGESIVAIYQLPLGLLGTQTNPYSISDTLEMDDLGGHNFYEEDYTDVWGGYVPHNKKMFTYPYSYITLTNWCGDTVNLRYERFNDIWNLKFRFKGASNPVPECIVYPVSYAEYKKVGSTSVEKENVNYGLVSKNFPNCAVANDSYKAWLAQNINSLEMGAKTDKLMNELDLNLNARKSVANGFYDYLDIVNGNLRLLVGSIGGGLNEMKSGYQGITNKMLDYSNQKARNEAQANVNQAMILAAKRDHQPVPDTMTTQAGSSSIMYAMGYKKFTVQHMTITTPYLKAIDQYFDLFGYASNRVHKPNRNVRKYWCFCKTQNCVINATMPTDHEEAIQDLYNNGLRFWRSTQIKNGNNTGTIAIGDFSPTNCANNVPIS